MHGTTTFNTRIHSPQPCVVWLPESHAAGKSWQWFLPPRWVTSRARGQQVRQRLLDLTDWSRRELSSGSAWPLQLESTASSLSDLLWARGPPLSCPIPGWNHGVDRPIHPAWAGLVCLLCLRSSVRLNPALECFSFYLCTMDSCTQLNNETEKMVWYKCHHLPGWSHRVLTDNRSCWERVRSTMQQRSQSSLTINGSLF